MNTRLDLWIVCGSLDLPETHLVAALTRNGFHVTVLHATPFRPEREAILREAGVEIVDLRFRNRLDLLGAYRLHRELARRPCDIIYAPLNKALAISLQAVIGHPDVRVVGYRGTIGHLTRWDPSSWLTYFHPRLDHVVAVSKAVRNYLVDKIRLPADKVTCIYKGHDPAWYAGPATTRPPRPAGAPLTLCFTGRIRPVKGIGFLLDALQALPADLNVRLLLVGRLSDREVQARLESHEDPRVEYLGVRTDIPDILRRTDLFIMPTIAREGLARSVIEAMSQQLPCIVSDVGGLPELIIDGETGLVVPPSDSQALAQAIERLARDEGLRTRLGTAARDRIETVFNIRSTVSAFQGLFSGLCNREE